MTTAQAETLGPVSEAVVMESVRVSRSDRDEIRRIRLRIEDPAFRVAMGQSIGVVVPGPHPMGNAYHMRRYSIAGQGPGDAGEMTIDLLVRRCFGIDEFSGESYPGIASNYLCDAQNGQEISVTGPFRSPFRLPADPRCNLLMIGTGTGIAPFRSFIQAIYRQHQGWSGQVRLYYGARSGMDVLYRNDREDDLAQYYDEATFEAFRGISSRPAADESDAMEAAVAAHASDVWTLLQAPLTHVFLAGLKPAAQRFEGVMSAAAPTPDAWRQLRDKLVAAGRWSELVYD